MPFLFPFEGGGCHVEVLSTLGVRYQGVLKSVDAGNKSITLTNVHHFGSETRVVEGVAPITAKGALPADEERLIYAIYISGARRIPPESLPPPPSPPPANNTVDQQTSKEANITRASSVAGPSCRLLHAHCQLPASEGPGTSTILNDQPYSSSLAGRLSSYFNEDDVSKQPMVVPSYGADYLQRLPATMPIQGLVPVMVEEKVTTSDGRHSHEPPGARRSRCARRPPNGTSDRSGDDEARPVYFIAQHLHIVALGVLLNGDEHPRAPIFVGINCTGPVGGKRVCLGQKWRLPAPPTTAYRVIYPNLSIAPRFSDGGMIGMDAELRSNEGMELAEEQAIEYREGKIVSQRQIKERNMDGVVRKNTYVEVAVKGAVSGVRLSNRQFDGLYADFLALAEGDHVEVEMVRLEEGCRVGPNYLLPDIYCNASLSRELHGIETARARTGDYLPVRIRELPSNASDK